MSLILTMRESIVSNVNVFARNYYAFQNKKMVCIYLRLMAGCGLIGMLVCG